MSSTFCIECGDLRISPNGGTLAICRVSGEHPTPTILPEPVAIKFAEMRAASNPFAYDDELVRIEHKLDDVLEALRELNRRQR